MTFSYVRKSDFRFGSVEHELALYEGGVCYTYLSERWLLNLWDGLRGAVIILANWYNACILGG